VLFTVQLAKTLLLKMVTVANTFRCVSQQRKLIPMITIIDFGPRYVVAFSNETLLHFACLRFSGWVMDGVSRCSVGLALNTCRFVSQKFVQLRP
jgi:hypothetical protein